MPLVLADRVKETTTTTGTGTVTLAGASIGAAAASGTAGYFRINTSAPAAVVQGTCGTSGTDMILTNTNIASGQTVQFTSLTITAFGA
jgi:Spy/CpxP family protein refolding chaperone